MNIDKTTENSGVSPMQVDKTVLSGHVAFMNTYKTTVGLEVHAELKTKSKMFCGCKNNPHEGEPNAHVCPVCMAHPGTHPTINKEAVISLL